MSATTPQMPRRQSCDRCHNQKVRCHTDGPEEIFIPGGTADNQVISNGRFVSSFPCRRCTKAGAPCIFSPQLRSGRPRLTRNSKRIPTSTMPSSARPPPSPSKSISSSPLSISTPYFGLTDLVNPEDYGSIPGLQVPPVPLALDPTGILTPVSHLSTEDQGNLGGFGPWLGSPFTPHNIPLSYLEAPCSSASSNLLPRDATGRAPSLFAAVSATSPSGVLPVTDFVWDDYSLSFEDQFEELGQIHKRIYQIARSVRSVTASSSSPLAEEIFKAGSWLVNLTTRYTTSRQFELGSGPSPQPTLSNVHNSVDTSFCLMVIGCHQVILAVFQGILASLVHSFRDTSQSHCPSETPTFTSSLATETDKILKLANNFLGQFDGSLVGLLAVMRADNQPPSSSSSSDSFDEVGGHANNYYWQFYAEATAFRQAEWRRTEVQKLLDTVRSIVEYAVVT
ncbi:hypothetical protein B0T14DRAFT_47815 [Immersiella caudata]|uniref:Zn(2)-C6 fungal-type domain-containing protein n=1 Tax=Immersiella caudata TaxID=314043 RepID=A0AA39XGI7_9PEZI|nr:hypothetical protein B0T14DRAFT_47815 [Immersiella caudata]